MSYTNEQNKPNILIYNIWHNKLFDDCYTELDQYSFDKIIMYDVNPVYEKIYNKDRGYNIMREYELPNYNSLLQANNYCQTSCFYHIYKNKEYLNCDYIGFIQYDMTLHQDFIYDMENIIANTEKNKTIIFHDILVESKMQTAQCMQLCEPYSGSLIEKYNMFFGTKHTYQSILESEHVKNFICLHTFVMPINMFEKMMSWFVSIMDWLHINYVNNIFGESMAEVTEEICGIFFILQMIETDIVHYPLKLTHEWPKLHNETVWNNYKESYKTTNINFIKNKYESECNKYSDIHEHLPTLYKYASECESVFQTCINAGVTSWAFVYGLLNNNNPNTKRLFINDVNEYDIDDLIKYTSNIGIDINKQWINNLNLDLKENYDITFIDTWHVYGQLKRELNKFSKITNKYIIMHDTTVDEIYGETIRCGWDANKQSIESGFPVEEITCGLWKAVEEFLDNNKDWKIKERFTNNNGLTILEKNGNESSN